MLAIVTVSNRVKKKGFFFEHASLQIENADNTGLFKS